MLKLCGSLNCAAEMRCELRQVRLSLNVDLAMSDTHPTTFNIVKTFPNGWKNLPQEFTDGTLAYLEDYIPSLVSCSELCKALTSALPIILFTAPSPATPDNQQILLRPT